MNERKKNTMNNIWQTCILLQSALHQLEDIEDDVIFVRQNKPRLKNTLNWLESICGQLTENFSGNEADEYVQHIKEVDDFINNFELTI